MVNMNGDTGNDTDASAAVLDCARIASGAVEEGGKGTVTLTG